MSKSTRNDNAKGKKRRSEDNGFAKFGGYMQAKVSKLDEQFAIDSAKNPYKKSDLFTGISIFVNGLTNPSADELKRIMMTNGGVYHTYQRTSTVFIIASNLPDVKIRQMSRSDREKVISPNWILDCLHANRILDYANYLLYTDRQTNQPKINFSKIPQIDDNSIQKTVESNPEEHEEVAQIPKLNVPNDIGQNLAFLNKQICESNVFKSDLEEKQNAEPKKNLARTAVDPNFLSEFYNNSRLHHIATLGADFKDYISELREKYNGEGFPARESLLKLIPVRIKDKNQSIEPFIMHIDMDCFFVSVGIRTRPHLKGLPVAVTHSKGSNPQHQHNEGHQNGTKQSLSEIASCSYEAREKGLKNGMFVGEALKLCPNLKTIPYDFKEYKEVAQTLYDTIAKYTLDIEGVSCDEMYVDLTELIETTNISVMDFVTNIRREITEKTNCPCSAGVGSNRLQARMATKKAKPNGQFLLEPEMVEEYFRTISISELPGVGYSTNHKLKHLGWKTCEDLQEIPLARLKVEFGAKFGEKLYKQCRGTDTQSLKFDQVRKSVSTEVNYGIRFKDNSELETFLRQLCQEVYNRLCHIKCRGKSITLKYMIRADEAPVETAKFMGHGLCDHITKTATLPDFMCNLDIIEKTVLSIKNMLNVTPSELRGIGIQISKLDRVEVNDRKKFAISNAIKSMFQKINEKNQSLSSVTSKLEIQRNILPSTSNPTTPTKSGNISVRGRKRGVRGKRRNSINTRGNRDVSSMLSECGNEKLLKNSIEYESIDENVLSELPDDIRQEIIKEFKKINGKLKIEKNQLSNNDQKIDPEFLAALPSDIRAEFLNEQKMIKKQESEHCRIIENEIIEKDTQLPENPNANILSTDNVLVQSDWRNTLKCWLESTDEPIELDISIVTDYSIEMINAKRISELYICLRYLYRIINEREICKWHKTYYKIIECVQVVMIAVYGYCLSTKKNFNCISCDRVSMIESPKSSRVDGSQP